MIRAWKRFAAYVLISLAILVGMDMARADGGPSATLEAGHGNAPHADAGSALTLRERAWP